MRLIAKIVKIIIIKLFINIANLFAIKKVFVFHRFISKTILKIKIENRYFIDSGFDCLNPDKITIKDGASLGHYNKLWAFEEIIIGRHVQTAIGLTIVAGSHNTDDFSPKPNQRVVIGPGCWIGANVTIIGGVTIGKGSIIAAGAVVTKDIPEFSIAGGVPAKVIKPRIPADIVMGPFGKYKIADIL